LVVYPAIAFAVVPHTANLVVLSEPVRAELVEALSFFGQPIEKQGFDKLSPNGGRAVRRSSREDRNDER
jgi:hypothetical protein